MNVLVTGTEGYIGSILAPTLIERGHRVVGVDTGFFKDGCLYHDNASAVRTLNKDIRQISSEDLKGIEAVVHMAELSNDPVGQLSPEITYQINHRGSVRLALEAREAGVRRFVYTSSCSVYGVANDDCVTEESPLDPQTDYAKCKALVERDLRPLAGGTFSPVFLRNATVFGPSPRMRFDIVLNNLSGLAWTRKEIRMTSDGSPWRPLVHVLDICKAITCALEAPRETVHNQIFNVGDTAHNYRVKDIAGVVADVFDGCKVSYGRSDGDNRSYRVSFDKISGQLPGFKCEWDIRRGTRQLYDLFNRISLTEEIFSFRGFTRLKQLEYLIQTRQIDKDFFWSNRCCSGKAN